jgi:hypothetical protein
LATRFRNIRVESSGSLPARSIDRMCQKNHASRSAPIRTKSQTGEIDPAGRTTTPPITKSCDAMIQPYVPACRMPTTTKNRPAADSTAPRRSNFGFGPCTPGSTIRRLRTRIAPTTRACTTNDTRQLVVVVMRPPISGPAAAPIPPAALIEPKARARDVTSAKNTVARM